MDFSKFDGQIDKEQLQKDIAEAGQNTNYEKVKDGVYLCDIDKLEIRETKDGRPMLSAQFRIIGDEDGNKCDFTKHCLFFNRVLFGTKNDANMIASAIGWLKNLEPSKEVVFENYTQFADLVMDIAEELIDEVEVVVDYKESDFNSVSISAVYDKE